MNGTRTPDIRAQANQIHIQGKGLYRFHTLIETIIFQSLCYVGGIESGYGQSPQTYSRCIMTIEDNGVTKRIYSGYAAKFVPESKGQVSIYVDIFDGSETLPQGAGALQEL